MRNKTKINDKPMQKPKHAIFSKFEMGEGGVLICHFHLTKIVVP